MIQHSVVADGSAKPWVVFVHGAGGSSAVWWRQVRPFSKDYHLVLLDVHAEGNRSAASERKNYTFDALARDVLEVLEFRGIDRAFFVGVSMGCLVIEELARLAPSKVSGMILTGAIAGLDWRTRLLMGLGHLSKDVLPYMWLYRFFAWVILPRWEHRESRKVFVREASKLGGRAFRRWYALAGNLNSSLKRIRQVGASVPCLYVMGEEDALFLKAVQDHVRTQATAWIEVIDHCGHVVNIQAAEQFNRLSLTFMASISGGNVPEAALVPHT
jgi:pimeloyl-ACP methyl ester carboxylesterase